MSPIAPVLNSLAAEIEGLTESLGRRVDVRTLGVTNRDGHLPLGAAGLRSPNGACGLIEAADGWIAVNLARVDDRDLIPAWLGCECAGDPWVQIARSARDRSREALVAQATLLGLPVSAVGEIAEGGLEAPILPMVASDAVERSGPLKVVDLSALWAGPLCGAVLAEMGAAVIRIESVRRPDPTATSTPDLFRLLNRRKAHLGLDFTAEADLDRLREAVLDADVLITSARPRAFAPLGLDPGRLFAANPRLVWAAITGYGWDARTPGRVAFGDDAAAAGGLVRWNAAGAPRFLGDALADPLTGLAAAVGALKALTSRGGVLVDAALARCAAGAAAKLGCGRDA